jgi:excisionase family DNA binding protein
MSEVSELNDNEQNEEAELNELVWGMEKTKEQRDADDRKIHQARKDKNSAQLEPLFKAYRDDGGSVASEHDLLKWVLNKLSSAIQGKYTDVALDGRESFGDWQENAQEQAAKVAVRIATMLREKKPGTDEGRFETHKDLLGYMYECIDKSWLQARGDKNERQAQVPIFSSFTNDDGEEMRTEVTPKVFHNFISFTRQDQDLLPYLPKPNREFFGQFRSANFSKDSTCRYFEMASNTFDQNRLRLAAKIAEVKGLIEALRGPMESFTTATEHFTSLVSKVKRMPKQDLPQSFAEVVVLSSTPDTSKVRIFHRTPPEAVKYLLKLMGQGTGIVESIQACAAEYEDYVGSIDEDEDHRGFIDSIQACAAPAENKLVDLVRAYDTAITVPQLARILQCSKRQIYELVQDKRLPAIRIGTSIRLDPISVADWIRSKMTIAA